MSILDNIKNIFSKKSEVKKIDNSNKFLDILKKTGISDANFELITKYGINEESIEKGLKEILYFTKHEIKNAVAENIPVYSAFQIAKVLGLNEIVYTYSPNFNIERYSHKTNIKCRISQDVSDNCLAIYEKGSKFSGNKITINDGNLCFLGITPKNAGTMINKAVKDKESIIGFTSSNSILDAHLFGVRQLIYNICEMQPQKPSVKISEMDLIQKFQSTDKGGNVNFDEILFSLEKVDELAATNMLQNFGVNITPEMKKTLKKQQSIIHSMTAEERKNPGILINNSSRIGRIAKGSGNTIEEVMKLVSMIDMIKKHGNKFAANMMNPATMMNNFNPK